MKTGRKVQGVCPQSDMVYSCTSGPWTVAHLPAIAFLNYPTPALTVII